MLDQVCGLHVDDVMLEMNVIIWFIEENGIHVVYFSVCYVVQIFS